MDVRRFVRFMAVKVQAIRAYLEDRRHENELYNQEAIGRVDIPQEAFLAVLKVGEGE